MVGPRLVLAFEQRGARDAVQLGQSVEAEGGEAALAALVAPEHGRLELAVRRGLGRSQRQALVDPGLAQTGAELAAEGLLNRMTVVGGRGDDGLPNEEP